MRFNYSCCAAVLAFVALHSIPVSAALVPGLGSDIIFVYDLQDQGNFAAKSFEPTFASGSNISLVYTGGSGAASSIGDTAYQGSPAGTSGLFRTTSSGGGPSSADITTGTGSYLQFTATRIDPNLVLSGVLVDTLITSTTASPNMLALYADVGVGNSYIQLAGNFSLTTVGSSDSIYQTVAFDFTDFAAPATTTFRIAYFGGNTTGGTIRFDNIALQGTVIPEPSTVALAAMGLVGCFLYRRRRSS